jgi:hypothetical protein
VGETETQTLEAWEHFSKATRVVMVLVVTMVELAEAVRVSLATLPLALVVKRVDMGPTGLLTLVQR